MIHCICQTVVDKVINKFILLLDSVYSLQVVDFCETAAITNNTYDKICDFLVYLVHLN
jgi:hypothetical protein